MEPKISVIVPVYKAENYLHRCIDSILAQTFTDFELLLVDDGSPDKSGAICDEYAKKDSRIRVFHKENGGVSSARNCGIENAIGEYTIHADPDDWVEPTMLEELYNKAIEDDADMVICDFIVDITPEKIIYSKQQPSKLDSDTVLCELFQQLHGSCCNKLVKRVCYSNANIKFDNNLSFCEDLHFIGRILKQNIKITYLPKAFYHYDQYLNSNSIVKNNYTIDIYKYDEMLFSIFEKEFKNTLADKYCKYKMGNMLLHRAFNGNIFSSKDFCKIGFRYRECAIKTKQSYFNRYKLYFSCIGFYRIVYNISSIIHKIVK